MELLLRAVILTLCGVLFGLVGRELTRDERGIYRRWQYFPLFSVALLLITLTMMFAGSEDFLVPFFVFIMIQVWNYGIIPRRRKK